MTDTLEASVTEVVEITAEDDQEMTAHYVCEICYPEMFLGVPAICGEKLLGIDAAEDSPDCDDCTDILPTHIIGHWLRGELPSREDL